MGTYPNILCSESRRKFKLDLLWLFTRPITSIPIPHSSHLPTLQRQQTERLNTLQFSLLPCWLVWLNHSRLLKLHRSRRFQSHSTKELVANCHPYRVHSLLGQALGEREAFARRFFCSSWRRSDQAGSRTHLCYLWICADILQPPTGPVTGPLLPAVAFVDDFKAPVCCSAAVVSTQRNRSFLSLPSAICKFTSCAISCADVGASRLQMRTLEFLRNVLLLQKKFLLDPARVWAEQETITVCLFCRSAY